jgi:hypothetical protein
VTKKITGYKIIAEFNIILECVKEKILKWYLDLHCDIKREYFKYSLCSFQILGNYSYVCLANIKG